MNKIIKVLIWVPGFFWLFPLICYYISSCIDKGKKHYLMRGEELYLLDISSMQAYYTVTQIIIIIVMFNFFK